MANVLVTNADSPLGRRVTKTLYHDEAVGRLLAVGSGPVPRAFDRFLTETPPRVAYARVNLARQRPVMDLFHSSEFRSAGIDTVAHIPPHGSDGSGEVSAAWGLPPRTAQARLVLQQSQATPSVRNLVAVGSAYVYRLVPGNANRLKETSELDLDPDSCREIRSWVDCDMLTHGEIGSTSLRVTLLRVPTVVASGGYVYLNPSLEGRAGLRVRPIGFDPFCALVADKDVAAAVQVSIHANASGIYHISGVEAVPLSRLGHWTGRRSVPIPGPLLTVASKAMGWLGGAAGGTAYREHLQYGFTLDTSRAERELGFRPRYRIGLARTGDGALRLEISPAELGPDPGAHGP